MDNTSWSWSLGSWTKPTPQFAKTIFEMYFYGSKIVVGYLSASHLLPEKWTLQVILFITLVLDLIVKVLTKMYGITIDDGFFEDKNNS